MLPELALMKFYACVTKDLCSLPKLSYNDNCRCFTGRKHNIILCDYEARRNGGLQKIQPPVVLEHALT